MSNDTPPREDKKKTNFLEHALEVHSQALLSWAST